MTSKLYLAALAAFFLLGAFLWHEILLSGVGLTLTTAGLLWLEREKEKGLRESDRELIRASNQKLSQLEERISAMESTQNVRRAVGR